MKRRFLLPGILLLVAGIAVLLYYPAVAWLEGNRRAQEIAQFQTLVQKEASDFTEETESAPGGETEQSRDDARLYDDMVEYNQSIYENGQSGLVDAWSYEQPVFSLSMYGLGTDIIGYLEIPAMKQTLPVYLGASMENLAKGVAVLGQTSMPIGGENTNCVIAGHRGNGSDDIFREIQLLQPGDQVSLTNPWQTLTYKVDSAQIIEPDQLEAIKIQEGKDLLTLISCHPELEGTHRYVVFCSRDSVINEEISQPMGSVVQETQENDKEDSLTQAEQRVEKITWLEEKLPFLAIPLVLLAAGLIFWPRKKRHGRKE